MSEETIRAAHAHLAATYGEREDHTFVPDPHVQTTASGLAIVRLQQHYGGIPLFGGDVAVHLDGANVVEVIGDVPRVDPGGEHTPDLSATDAVIATVAHFQPRTDRTVCQVPHRSLRGAAPVPATVASFPFPSRPTVFRLGRGNSSPAAYLAYSVLEGAPRLVWVVRAPFLAQSYLVLVAADGDEKGSVVFCTRWSSGARCFGTVFSFDHAAGRQRLEFPLPIGGFPPLLPHPNAQFIGQPWVDSQNRTAGNNAVTFDRNSQTLLRAALNGNNADFAVAGPATKNQTLLNAFFYCNFLHDFFLMLGFGEAEGNFQLQNFSTTRGGNDRLEIRVFDQKTQRLGDMNARDDGDKARLSLNRAPNNEPAALHAELVIHEYTHGVVHRMVGGRLSTAWLVQQQSQAMDEGWADYFAITLRNHYLAVPDYNFANWAGFAVRSASYDPAVPRDFGRLGRTPNHTVNGAGEIFAAALIRFNELLGASLNNAARGHSIGWRAVIESLRLIRPNPNFLQGRRALLDGITELERGGTITQLEASDARGAAQAAFARYGMGRNAISPTASFGGTTSDFTV